MYKQLSIHGHVHTATKFGCQFR